MINGNIDEFVDKLWGGEELTYPCNGKNISHRDIFLRMDNIVLNYSNGNQKEKRFGKLSKKSNG